MSKFQKYLSLNYWSWSGNDAFDVVGTQEFAEKGKLPLDTDLLKDNSDYVRNALVAVSAKFHDLGDKSKLKYLV